MLENRDRERECIYIYMAYEKRREQATKTTAQRFFSPWCIFLLALLSFFTIETSYTYSTNQAGFLPQYIEKDKNRSRSYILKNINSWSVTWSFVTRASATSGPNACLHWSYICHGNCEFVKKREEEGLVHIRGYSHGNGILGKLCRKRKKEKKKKKKEEAQIAIWHRD